MKAIKKFVTIVFCVMLVSACNKKNPNVQTLDESTKAYFGIKDNSTFVFTEVSDTNISIEYRSKNYINSLSNPDIENNEIMSYDLEATGMPLISIRSESGGLQYKDRVAMISKYNDTTVIGPVVFNLANTFSVAFNSGDSVFQYGTFNINGMNFNDVVRIKPKKNTLYSEIYYAKNIGLIGRKEKSGKFYYVKRYSVNQ
jgi:hypothetical protein